MKIGINALFLQTPASGSGQYLIHLLKALAEIDKQNEYILLGAKPPARDSSDLPYHVSPVPTAFAVQALELWHAFQAGKMEPCLLPVI